jgi:hypothetical protein
MNSQRRASILLWRSNRWLIKMNESGRAALVYLLHGAAKPPYEYFEAELLV